MADSAPDIADTPYTAARASGWSDAEIRAHVRAMPEYQEALKEGYADPDVMAHYGVPAEHEVSAAVSQQTGAARALMYPSEALAGVASTLGLPGDALNAIGLNGSPDSPLAGTPLNIRLPTSQDLVGVTNRLGLTNRADMIPGWLDPPGQPGWEHTGAAAARGVGSTLPMLPFGPADTIVPSLAAGAGGSIAADQASRLHPGDPWAPAITGTLAGTLTGGLASAGTKAINAMRGVATPEAQLFRTAGMPLRSAPMVSSNPLVQSSLGGYVPLGQLDSDMRSSLQTTARGLGQSTTLQEAGEYAQNQARNWLKTTMPAKEAAAWKPVDALVPPTTPTPLSNFRATLDSITTQAGSLSPAEKLLRPGLPEQLKDLFKASPGAYKNIFSGSPGINSSATTWAEVRRLRSAIGQAMSDPQIAPKAGPQNLERLYAATTQDLAMATQQVGPWANGRSAATDAFNSANAESSRLHQFAEGPVAQIIRSDTGRGDAKPEDVAKRLLGQGALERGGTGLAALNTELPDVTRELAAAHLNDNILSSSDLANAKPVTPALLRSWGNISPEAREALVTDPGTRSRLDAMTQIAQKASGLKPAGAGASPAHASVTSGLPTAAASYLANTALAHAGHGGLVSNESAAALGELVGTFGPAAGRAVRGKLAASPTYAAYSAGAPPSWLFGGQLPLTAMAGAEGERNELGPKRPGQ